MNVPVRDPDLRDAKTTSRRITHRSVWQVFRTPLFVALVSSAGLAFALFGDGIWDGLSWLALVVPILLSLVFGLRKAPAEQEDRPRVSKLRV